MDIFFKCLNILISSVLYVYALMVLNVFPKAFHYPIQLLTVYLLPRGCRNRKYCEIHTRLCELAGSDVFGIFKCCLEPLREIRLGLLVPDPNPGSGS
jgi:hypothetical protein